MKQQIALSKDGLLDGIASIECKERGPDNVAGRTRAILLDKNDESRNTLIAGGVSGGLWRTTNLLDEVPDWKLINDFWANLMVSCIAQDPNNPSLIYVGTGEGWFREDERMKGFGIWSSTDGGLSFEQLPLTRTPTFSHIQDILVDNYGVIYAIPQTTNGEVFTRSQARHNLIASVDPNNEDRVFIGGVNLYVSSNGGRIFRQFTPDHGTAQQYVHADQHAIQFAEGSSDFILFANDGGVWLSTDGSARVPRVIGRNKSYNVTQFYSGAIHPFNNDYMLGGTWMGFSGAGRRVDMASDGTPSIVSQTNQIYTRIGGSWKKMPGRAFDIGCGADSSIYWVGNQNTVNKWNGLPWNEMPNISAFRVDVDGNGFPWIINVQNEVLRFNGIDWAVMFSEGAQGVSCDGLGNTYVTSLSGETYKWARTVIDETTTMDSALVEDTPYVGTEGLAVKIAAQAFPNPFTDELNLSFGTLEEGVVQLQFFDANGQVRYKYEGINNC